MRRERREQTLDNNIILESWLARYSGLILSICYSMTRDYFQAEDLAQDTFVAAYRSIDRFDGNNEKAYLVKIATNKCRDYLKSAGRRSMPSEEWVFAQLADTGESAEQILLDREVKAKLDILCRSLKEPYRSVALAHFVEGKTAAEIARIREKNLKTIQTQIYRAKALLKKLWKEEPV